VKKNALADRRLPIIMFAETAKQARGGNLMKQWRLRRGMAA